MSSTSDQRVKQFLGSVFCTLVLLSFTTVSTSQAQDLDVPYVPTPQPVVERMLDLTHVEPGDYVIDLGSGDGRIVISAAKRGATGHGVDLDPQRISEARENAENEGVDNRVMFVRQNIFETDISQASVITMYLLSSVNEKMRPRLFEMLRPGTRVVSHSFDMGDWEPDSSLTVESSMGRGHTIYLWIMPAQVEGAWSWNVEGTPFNLEVDQQYQEIDVNLEANGSEIDAENVVLRGKRISFSARNGNRHYLFSGRVEGDSISGTVQLRSDEDRILEWTAERR